MGSSPITHFMFQINLNPLSQCAYNHEPKNDDYKKEYRFIQVDIIMSFDEQYHINNDLDPHDTKFHEWAQKLAKIRSADADISMKSCG